MQRPKCGVRQKGQMLHTCICFRPHWIEDELLFALLPVMFKIQAELAKILASNIRHFFDSDKSSTILSFYSHIPCCTSSKTCKPGSLRLFDGRTHAFPSPLRICRQLQATQVFRKLFQVNTVMATIRRPSVKHIFSESVKGLTQNVRENVP